MVARKVEAVTAEYDPEANVQVAPDDWEWETVQDETPIGVVFEEIGDTFIGQYTGIRHVDREPSADGKDQSFDLFVFRGRDGKPYSLNNSFILAQAMGNVEVGNWCRIKYVKNVEVANWSSPMKDFTIDIRK